MDYGIHPRGLTRQQGIINHSNVSINRISMNCLPIDRALHFLSNSLTIQSKCRNNETKKTTLQLAHHQFQRFDISTSRRPDGAFLCVLWFIGRCMCPPLTAVSIRPVSATPSAVIDGIVLYDTKQMCTDSNWPLLRTCRTWLCLPVGLGPLCRPPHPPRFPERPATSPLNVNVFHFFLLLEMIQFCDVIDGPIAEWCGWHGIYWIIYLSI